MRQEVREKLEKEAKSICDSEFRSNVYNICQKIEMITYSIPVLGMIIRKLCKNSGGMNKLLRNLWWRKIYQNKYIKKRICIKNEKEVDKICMYLYNSMERYIFINIFESVFKEMLILGFDDLYEDVSHTKLYNAVNKAEEECNETIKRMINDDKELFYLNLENNIVNVMSDCLRKHLKSLNIDYKQETDSQIQIGTVLSRIRNDWKGD